MLFPVISLYTTPFSITTFFLILKTAQVLFRFSADRWEGLAPLCSRGQLTAKPFACRAYRV